MWCFFLPHLLCWSCCVQMSNETSSNNVISLSKYLAIPSLLFCKLLAFLYQGISLLIYCCPIPYFVSEIVRIQTLTYIWTRKLPTYTSHLAQVGFLFSFLFTVRYHWSGAFFSVADPWHLVRIRIHKSMPWTNTAGSWFNHPESWISACLFVFQDGLGFGFGWWPVRGRNP